MFRIYDPENEQWVDERPWMVELNVAEEETMILYDLLTAGPEGSYALVTEVEYVQEGTYQSLGSVTLEFSIIGDERSLREDILSALESLQVSGKDKASLERAIRYVEAVGARGAATRKEIEENIADLLQAIEALRTIGFAELSETRRLMDFLLRLWQSRWYLSSSDSM